MNKQQLCLVLDQIDPRYLDEAAGYRGRSPKRAARALLIAAVILLLGAIFSVGAFSAFRSVSLGYGEFIRPGAPTYKKHTLADGTALNLTYSHSTKPKTEVAYQPTYDVYLHGQDEYHFDTRGQLLSFYNNDRSLIFPQPEPIQEITRDRALEIAKEHLEAFYGIPPGYRQDRCDYNNESYFITYTRSLGQNGFIEGDYAAVFIQNNGILNGSKAPKPDLTEGLDLSKIATLSPEDLETYVKDQIIFQYGEGSCLACDLIDAYLQKDEEETVQLIAYTYVNIRGRVPTEMEFIYPLE